MQENRMPTPPYNYKVGDKTSSGETIAFIYGQSPDVIVFEDTNKKLQWSVRPDQLSPTQKAVQRTFDRLDAKRNLWIPDGERSDAREEMRSALFLALSEEDVNKALDHLQGVSAHIDTELLSQAKILYLRAGFSAALCACVVGGILWGIAYNNDIALLSLFALATIGGAFGSWTSVLQRTPSLAVAPFEVPSWIRFQSFYRIVVGVTFGLVALILLKTNFLAPSFLENTWQFFLLAFVSGFSERFIPELLARAENGISPMADGKKVSKKSN